MEKPTSFPQKYKTYRIEKYLQTNHTAWVKTFEKQPVLLLKSCFAFLPNPKIYWSCRPTILNDFVAEKSARQNQGYRFLDIENDSPIAREQAEGKYTGVKPASSTRTKTIKPTISQPPPWPKANKTTKIGTRDQ